MLAGAEAASVDTAPGVCTTDVGAPTDGVPVWSGVVGEEGGSLVVSHRGMPGGRESFEAEATSLIHHYVE